MSQTKALVAFHLLLESERAFAANSRERGWALLESAEQTIPEIEPDPLFRRAQAHASRVWKVAVGSEVQVLRDGQLAVQVG